MIPQILILSQDNAKESQIKKLERLACVIFQLIMSNVDFHLN